jgi:beta-1,4-mannosyl-glycoprotein beta-1,4-N-acetylglucosaminyltransferase
MFNGEDIIKMRLEYYKDFFDEFYFTESWYTFTGKRKPFLYCEKYAEWFAPYKEKVKFHILNDIHSLNPWEQEEHQRNAVVPRILSEHPDAIVFFSDCDEFYDIATLPSQEKMIEMTCKNNKVVHVEMKLYQCRFTNVQKLMTWTNAFFLHTSLLQNTPNLHELRIFKNQKGIPIPAECIKSGWHFSHFMTTDEIIRKLESFSHQELNLPMNKDKKVIQENIEKAKDIYNRNVQVEYIGFDDSFHGYPELFRKYHEKLTQGGCF